MSISANIPNQNVNVGSSPVFDAPRALTTPDGGDPYAIVNVDYIAEIGGGDVIGPASSTDYAVPAFNGTTGKLLRNTGLLTDVDGNFLVPGNTVLMGNATIFASAKRLIAPFSTATHSDRFMAQTSTSNGNTYFGVLPNGTGTVSGFNAYGYSASGIENVHYVTYGINATESFINSTKNGGGSAKDLHIKIDGTTEGVWSATGLAIQNDLGVTGAISLGNDLNFTVGGNRIQGNFNDPTRANRVLFGDYGPSEVATHVGLVPFGGGQGGSWDSYLNVDPDNSAVVSIGIDSTSAYIDANKTGLGTTKRLDLKINGSSKMQIGTDGSVSVLTTFYSEGLITANGSIIIADNINFTTGSNRITGDFSNATTSSRVLFENSSIASETHVGAHPSITATTASFIAYNTFDTDNSSSCAIGCDSTSAYVDSNKTGTGTTKSLQFRFGGTSKASIDTTGALSAYSLNSQFINSGSNGTQGSLTLYPATSSKGIFGIFCTDNAANYAVLLTNASYGQSTTLTIPDVGAISGIIPAINGSITGSSFPIFSGTTGKMVSSGSGLTYSTIASVLSASGGFVAPALQAGSDGVAGTLTIYPTTSSKGAFILQCIDNTGAFTMSLKNGAVGQNTVITIPNPSAATDTVALLSATQTLTNKTLSGSGCAIIGASAVTASITQGNLLSAGGNGVLGEVTIYPSTASKGYVSLAAEDNSGNTVTAITFKSQAAARTFNVIDTGNSSSDFVFNNATQTLTNKTYSSPIITGNIVFDSSSNHIIDVAGEVGVAGKNLTVEAGTPTSGTNLNGGNLILSSGDGFGTGTGNILLKASPGSGGSGPVAYVSSQVAQVSAVWVNPGAGQADGVLTLGASWGVGDFATGVLSLYPGADSKGYLKIRPVQNTGDYNVTISNSAFGQASTISIPDPGASSANFVLDISTQTLTNKTLTAPKIANAGFIADANGNEQLIFTTTSSAVNEITVKNAATGNAPSLAATGGDTNIDFNIITKGTGAFLVNGVPISGTSGTYTPTTSNVANLDASGTDVCQYNRVGNTVTVSGKVTMDPTTTLTLTQMGLTIPVSSNFAQEYQCSGVFSASDGTSGRIIADTSNDRAQFECTPASTSNITFSFQFTYLVI